MGMFDRLKKNSNDNYSDNYDDYYGGYDTGANYDDVDPMQEDTVAQNQQPASSFGYSAPAASVGGGMSLNGAAIELKVVKPTEFKDGPSIAEHLINKRTVVLNLEDSDKDTSRRLIDFLFGVAYSIGGEIKKVANNAYVITPQNVAISNDKAEVANAAQTQPQTDAGFYNY